jgi:DNA helicase HerA-like ATPase
VLPSAYRQLGKQPRLIHVFLEEADEFAPQRMPRGETKMFSAVEQTVRRGRARGLGITMITQRSAVLNKNVLEQTDVLIAMRTTGPNDRKAVAGWIAAKADESEGPGVVESLPTLETGEAWIWNPERDMLQLVKIRAARRSTCPAGWRPASGARPSR